MNLGAYDACLFDKSLGETLDIIAGLGLTSVEINSGGFLPPVHLPIDELRVSGMPNAGFPKREGDRIVYPKSSPEYFALFAREQPFPGGAEHRLGAHHLGRGAQAGDELIPGGEPDGGR